MGERPVKVRYTSRSLERHIAVPREQAWRALLEVIEARAGHVAEPDPGSHGAGAVRHLRIGAGEPLVETVLSFEPPWRRSARLGGDMPLSFFEATFVLRDDGEECHLSLGVVVDPEPSEEGWAFLDLALETFGAFLDQVTASALA